MISDERHATPENAYGGIRIKVVQVGDLARFAEEFFLNPAGQVMAPISRQRAIGMTHNPFADPDEPGLIVAYDREKVVAHYCLIPGLLATPEGSSKVLWGSALFVHPDYRVGGQVFLDLIQTVSSLQTDFVISGFTEVVHEIYKTLGFRELAPLGTCMTNVSKLDFFGAALWLARDRGKISEWAWEAANSVAPAMRFLFYRLLRSLYSASLARSATRELEGIGFREVQRVQARADTPRAFPHFVRGVEAVNWMLEYPWVRESATKPGLPSDPPYYFYDYREELFRHYAIEFDDAQGGLAGYLVFSVQAGGGGNRVLKLTDFSVRNQSDLATVFWIAALYAARNRVDNFEAASAMTPFMTQIPLARFLVRTGIRRYLCHAVKGGVLEKVFDQLELQYGDGDCAFT